MKKFMLSMMAATMMFATSCQNELDMPQAGATSEVTFTVSTPDMASRAYSNGATATVLQYAVYEGETELTDLTKSVVKENAETINGSKEVQLKLTTGNTYTVIFWAAAPKAPYAVDFSNKTMTVDYTGALSNDESRDAFYAKETFTVNGAQTETIELKRPFAQLNIGTNDYAASTSAGYTPVKSSVTVNSIYSTLNLWNGEVSGKTNATFGYADIAKNETFPVDNNEYLAMNYLLVADDKEVVDIEFGYTETDATAAKTRTVGSVPVQRNYRTNIYGQLLTSNVDINVEIEPVYNEPANELDALQNAALNGGEVTLTKDVVLTAPLEVKSNMTINLNGKTINVEEEATGKHIYAFENYGKLTIKGQGTINARGIFNYGTITLEGATINAIDGNGGYGVRNYEGAKLVMNSGVIATTLEDDNMVNNGGYDATPVRVDEGATFEMYGGELQNICDYTFALDNYGISTINGGKVTSVHTTLANYGTMTINGGEFTCNGLEGITAHVLWAADGEATINGGTFNGKDNYNGFNVDASKGAVVNIHGGNFEPVHSGSLYGEGTIIVDGGTFFDEVKSERLAEGYAAVKNAEGKWTVVATAKTAEELAEALTKGGIVALAADIKLTEAIEVTTNTTIDLNGKKITAELTDGIVAKSGAVLTITGNGEVISNGAPIRAIGGEITIESGEFTQTGTAVDSPSTYRYAVDCRENGKITINGGTFKSGNGMINVSSEVVINGGKFENIVEKTMTRHFAYVSAKLTINDGEFYGKANRAGGGCFFCGAAAECYITINGGKFTSLWTDGSVNRIFEVYFGGTINVTGGLFNTNGGIDNFVVENTDEATKVAYPYMAK